MKVAHSFLFLFSVFLLVNCSKDETSVEKPNEEEKPGSKPIENEPETPLDSSTEVYFSLDIDADYDTSLTDNWIIIHDKDGTLLDYKSYEAGDNLIFEVLKDSLSENISITRLVYRTYASYGESSPLRDHNYRLESYVNIEKGSKWRISKKLWGSERIRDTIIGEFELRVENIYSPVYSTVSNRNGLFSFSSTGIPHSDSPNVFDMVYDDLSLFSTPSYMYSCYTKFYENKYLFFDNTEKKSEITLDFNKFKNFDSYIEVLIPPNHIAFRIFVAEFKDENALKAGIGYTSHDFYEVYNGEIDVTEPIIIGYLDNFDIHRTIISYRTQNFNFRYEAFGKKPEEIGFPKYEPSLQISNESIENFEFLTNVDYSRKVSTWRYLIDENQNSGFFNTSWSVYDDNDHHPFLGKIPLEIQEKYPNLNLNKIIYESTRFYTDDTRYNEFINQEFLNSDKFHSVVQKSIYFEK